LAGLDVESDGMVDEVAIGVKFRALAGELNERQRRLWAASEASAAGGGGIADRARDRDGGSTRSARGSVSLRPGSRSGRGGSASRVLGALMRRQDPRKRPRSCGQCSRRAVVIIG
jgi:hypothetical protein